MGNRMGMVFVALLGAGSVWAQESDRPLAPATRAGKSLVITNVRVPDGQGVFTLRQKVVITDGLIAGLGDETSAPTTETSTGSSVDAGGGYLLPGLVDAHSHLRQYGGDSGTPPHPWNAPGVLADLDNKEYTVAERMATGNTGFIDLASTADIAGTNVKVVPDVENVGPLITAPGGHGTEYSPKPHVGVIQVADDWGKDDGLVKKVRAEIDALTPDKWAAPSVGAKIVYDGDMPDFEKWDHKGPLPMMPNLTKEQLAGVMEASLKWHQRVHIHVGIQPPPGAEPRPDAKPYEQYASEILQTALALRAKLGTPFLLSMEHWHGYRLSTSDMDVIRQLIEQGVVVEATPTRVGMNYWILEGLVRQRVKGEPGEVRDQLDAARKQVEADPAYRALEQADAEAIRRLAEAGVRVYAGTDVPFPRALTQEILFLAKAVLPADKDRRTSAMRFLYQIVHPHEVKKARNMGEGLINQGQPANLIVVPGDPLEDLTQLEKVSLVVVRGEVVGGKR